MTGRNMNAARTEPHAPDAAPPAERTCATCAAWHVPSENWDVGECASAQALEVVGTEFCPSGSFGCRFWVARNPAAHRAALVDSGVGALFDALYALAGRTRLPVSVDSIGGATRERLEIAVIRLAQAWGML